MNRSPILITSIVLALSVAGIAQADSPLRAKGIQSAPNYTEEEIRELERLEGLVKRFTEQVEEYRRGAREMLEAKYAGRKKTKFDYYESRIEALEDDQRVRRADAIAKFEEFINKYPDDGRYAPDALFRLSELYYERSYEQYNTANQEYDDLLEQWTPDSGAPEPIAPVFQFEPTIAAMQRLVTEFPDYRLVDGAYYLLGYCLVEQGEDDRAVKFSKDWRTVGLNHASSRKFGLGSENTISIHPIYQEREMPTLRFLSSIAANIMTRLFISLLGPTIEWLIQRALPNFMTKR